MIRLIDKVSALATAASLFYLSCGDTGVTPPFEPTDQDAIYNVIRYDRQSEFNIDLYDLTVPDTLIHGMGPIVPDYYWYHFDRDSLFIGIDIRYVQPGDPAGTIPLATVYVRKYFWGTMEISGADTSGGQPVPVRLSKNLVIVGQINSRFEKYGYDYNPRKGWIVTLLSDAVYNAGYVGAVSEILVRRESGIEYPVNTNPIPLVDALICSPGESLTVMVTPRSPDDFVRFSFRSSAGYSTREIAPDSSGQFVTGFRLGDGLGYNHFLVDVISNNSLTSVGDFMAGSVGVLYRVR